MTVKLLTPRYGYPILALYTADAATEAALIDEGVATADTTGGIVYTPPEDPPNAVPPHLVLCSAAQIASPTAAMLADQRATFQLRTAPFTRYRTNGTALVELGSGGGGGASSFAELSGSPTDNANLASALNTKLDAADVGAANGVAALDATGKVPAAQLTTSLSPQGPWNASTNTPTIAAASGSNRGHFYLVSVAGTTNIDGIASWNVGDMLVNLTGSAWSKIDNAQAVSSVASKTGAVTLVKADVGLGNVDNTADASKPVSSATQVVLDAIDARLDAIEAIEQSVVGQMLAYQCGWSMPGTFGGTAPSFVNTGSLGSSGTDYAGATAAGSGNFNGATVPGRLKGYRITSAASAGSITGRRANNGNPICLDMLGGGMFAVIMFGAADAATVANARSFAGWINQGSSADLTDVDPSSRTTFFGVAHDSGQANLRIMHNDASGTATAVDLGANFPQVSAQGYAAFWSNDAGATLNWLVKNFVNNEVATGVASTNLPSASTALFWHNTRANGSTALAVTLDHYGVGYGKVGGGTQSGSPGGGGGGGGSVNLDTLNAWTKPQFEPWLVLTDAATLNIDASLRSKRYVSAMAGNRTIATPTNPQDGMRLQILLRQDGSGNRVPSFSSGWHHIGGGAPVFSTAANAWDLVDAEYNAVLGKWFYGVINIGVA